MQKKLIALAIAAATSGAAFAQSNVTIYGTVDMGYMNRGGNSGGIQGTKSQNDLQSNSAESLVGFKGSEDLGNGLKAVFDLAYRITPDNNSGMGTAGAAHQYVGLSGGFGTAVAGYLNGLRYGIYGKYTPTGNSSVGNFASMTTQYDRAANAVAYISPSFNGFTLILAHATNTQVNEGGFNARKVGGQGNDGDDRLYSINLVYANGPLSVDLDYETTKAVGIDNSKLYVATAGASYDFGFMKLSGLYDVIKGDPNSLIGSGAAGADLGGLTTNPGATSLEYNRRNWLIGATVPVNAKLKLLASYGRVNDKSVDQGDSSKFSIGARYALSKRTELYTDFAKINNDTNAFYQMNSMGNVNSAGVGVRGFDFGIKHSF